MRLLETETNCPPLDLVLNKKSTDFYRRAKLSGVWDVVEAARRRVAHSFTTRTTRAGQTREAAALGWLEDDDEDTSRALRRHWVERLRQHRHRSTQGRTLADWQIPSSAQTEDGPKAWGIRRHKLLRKHESSLLIQIRTGRIGLRQFLFSRNVPGVTSPFCRCEEGYETATHLFLFCPELRSSRRQLENDLGRPLRTLPDLVRETNRPEGAATLVRWLLTQHRLSEYRVAEQIAATPPPDLLGMVTQSRSAE